MCFVAPKDRELIYRNELKILIFVFYFPEYDYLLVETCSHVIILTKNIKIFLLMVIGNYFVKNCIVTVRLQAICPRTFPLRSFPVHFPQKIINCTV